jgi:hypothetical protein
MKPFIFISSALLLFASCKDNLSVTGSENFVELKNNPEASMRVEGNGATLTPPSLAINTFKDASGKVTIKIFKSTRLYGPTITAKASVENGYVLVSGGAFIDNWSSDMRGAFIFESRPEANLKDWIATSSYIGTPECHYLTAYAVGLKVEGITADALRSKMKVFTLTSASGTNPVAQIEVNSLYTLIGGGAKSNSISPLIASLPYGQKWYAETMQIVQKGTVTSYGIGLENKTMDQLRLQITQHFNTSRNPLSSLNSETVSIPSDRVITSVGGRTLISSTAKRGLVCLYANSGSLVVVISKDFEKYFTGTNTLTAIAIRRY